jgi:diguanylate cyclase (GGDEF)-like protein
MNPPSTTEPGGRKPAGAPSRVLLTWILLSVSVVVLVGRAVVELMVGRTDAVDLVLALAISALVTSAVMNARAAGMQVERRHSETESFSRIVRALSRSVSPDAIVEAIVHELGAATGADHVAVVRLRPGSAALDVTFVSMLPGAPTSNTVMPLRQLDPVEETHLRDLPPQPSSSAPFRLYDGEPPPLGADDPEHGAGHAGAVRIGNTNRKVRSRGRTPRFVEGEAGAPEVADWIAYRLSDAYGLRNTLAAPLQTGRSIAGAIVLSRRTGEVWPESAVRLLGSAAAEASAALARVYSHQAAESEARTDQLTQLPNRRYFDEYTKLLVSRRRSTDRVAILAVDVDHFKRVNDLYGHQIGDVVLQAIANAIQASVREEDVPVRFGGEEFVVLLQNPSAGVALEIGERIRQTVRQLDLIEAGVTDRITVSVGVASGQHPGEAMDDIVERADRALYTAKRTGRNRVVEAWQPEVTQ